MTARPDLGAARVAREDGPSPYGRPVIKEPVWKPEIPFYLYTGGLAGASAGFALLCELRGDHGLARRAWITALAGSIASPALLIADLGMPRRFVNMLGMFKVTSPMSVGSWILAAFGTTTAPAAAHALTGGRLGTLGRSAQAASALLGIPLASYTAALLANTSIPVWHHARHELPFVLGAGAAMSAGAVAVALAPADEAAPARRLAIGGGIAEVALTQAMEQRLQRVGVGTPYHEGTAGTLAKGATALTASGVAVLVARGPTVAAGRHRCGGTDDRRRRRRALGRVQGRVPIGGAPAGHGQPRARTHRRRSHPRRRAKAGSHGGRERRRPRFPARPAPRARGIAGRASRSDAGRG